MTARQKNRPRNGNFKPIAPENWNREKLRDILDRFRKKKILVIGDVGVDRYTIGTVERISPEAPVPIVLVEEEKLKLGLAANVADNVQALGGTPLLAGIIGNDRAGTDLKKLLRDSGIPSRYLTTDASRRTVLKERIVSDRQQLLRVDYESLHGMSARVESQLVNRIRELVQKCDAVILEDYAKGMLSPKVAETVFREARRAGKLVAVDPNTKTSVETYQGASVLTPNTKEAEALAKLKITDDESLLEVGNRILRATSAKHVVITLGKDGMAVFTAGDRGVHIIPTYAREVYDVSGAGDTVISVLALSLASGASIDEAAVLGNLAAGVEVGKRGTATVSLEEIEMAMDLFLEITNQESP